jgi:hypothetical protein
MERLDPMIKQNKVNIKLEIIKDKSSGDLAIVAYFDSKAPNVTIDKNEYVWMPTIEEKDLIIDVFNYFSTKSILKQEEPKKTTTNEPFPKKIPEAEPIPEKIPSKDTKSEEKPEQLPPLEKEEEPTVFEITDDKITSDDLDTKPEKKETMDAKVNVKPSEPEEQKQTEEKKDDEEGIIVEADAATIEEALKKYTDKDNQDETIVEADEQTIIDKVLSQKKKGKWSKK